MADPYKDPLYQRNRKALLRDNPTCHWCGTAKATQADHLLELDNGGTNEAHNLVPSCGPCNASRGARHRNAKVTRRIAKRNEALEGVQVSCVADGRTPSPRTYIPLGGAHGDESDRFGPDLSGFGRVEPRLETPIVGSSSFGPALGAWASRVAGIELMPWQVRVLAGQLATDDAGNFQHRLAVASTGRQQGKSFALRALAGWWLTELAAARGEPQSVLLVSNKLDRTMPMFRALAELLETKFGAQVRWGNGSQQVTMPDGSVFRMAAAKDNHHGGTYDLILVDELWDIQPTVIFDALLPSQIARKNPLCSMWSTAGDQSSVCLLRFREQAMQAIDKQQAGRLYYAEWSPPPGINPDDRRWWGWANPALGHTVTLDALEAAQSTMDRASFLRAHLNLWIASSEAWLPPDLFANRQTDLPCRPTVLAVDSSVDESRYVGVLAGPAEHGVTVTVGFVAESETEMWAEIDRLMTDPQLQLAITPGLELHTPLPLRRRTHTVGYGELIKYTGLVRQAILEGRLWHTGETTLADHVGRAVLAKTNNAVVLSSQKSPGPIELARCMVWAAAEASRPVVKTKPAFASS